MIKKRFAVLALVSAFVFVLSMRSDGENLDLFGGLSTEKSEATADSEKADPTADDEATTTDDSMGEIDFGEEAETADEKEDGGEAETADEKEDGGEAETADEKEDGGEAETADEKEDGGEIDFGEEVETEQPAEKAAASIGDEDKETAPEEEVVVEEAVAEDDGKTEDVQVIVVGEDKPKASQPSAEPRPDAQELMKPTTERKMTGAPASSDLKVITKPGADESEKSELRHDSTFAFSQNIGRSLMLYLPNRLLDLYDIFTMDLGFGPECKLQLTGTHYFSFGGFYGDKYYVSKAYNRKIGAAHSMGWSYDEAWKTNKYLFVDGSLGTLENYHFLTTEFRGATPEDPVYEEDIKDFWEMGIGVGWLFVADFRLHPVDLADAVLGFFFIDIRGDDLR